MLSIDCILVTNDNENDARLTISNRRILIDLRKGGFTMFGKSKWIPLLDMDISEPLDITLGEKGRTVIINGHGESVTISSRDIPPDKLILEIERNIDIARNLGKNRNFSSKKVIFDLKKERGIR